MAKSLLRRLSLGLAALLGAGCGARTYTERCLLDPCLTDGTTLTVYLSVETGTRETSGGAFNPTGPQTKTTVTRSDLYQADFALSRDTATFLAGKHLLGVEGRSLDTAITTTDGLLNLVPPSATNDAEVVCLAPLGQPLCVRRDDRFTIYSDASRGAEVDAGSVPTLARLRLTWNGDRLYAIDSDAEGRISRIHHTTVGSGGVWESLVYDAGVTPLDADPGRTYVEAYDVLDGEGVLLLRKSYDQSGNMSEYRGQSYALLRGQRLVATWTGDSPGWIRPDLRAIMGWHRSHGSLQATLTLRSLDDGSLRTIAVDARPALPR